MSRVLKGQLPLPSTDAEILAEFEKMNGSGTQYVDLNENDFKSTWESSSEMKLVLKTGTIVHHPVTETTDD